MSSEPPDSTVEGEHLTQAHVSSPDDMGAVRFHAWECLLERFGLDAEVPRARNEMLTDEPLFDDLTDESLQAPPFEAEAPPPTLPPTVPIIIGAKEAASIYGITIDALYMRISRGQVAGLVNNGLRRVEFNREKLIAGRNARTRRTKR